MAPDPLIILVKLAAPEVMVLVVCMEVDLMLPVLLTAPADILVQFVLSGDRVEPFQVHSLQINNKKCQKQILQAHFEVTNTEAEDLLACGRLVLHPLTP